MPLLDAKHLLPTVLLGCDLHRSLSVSLYVLFVGSDLPPPRELPGPSTPREYPPFALGLLSLHKLLLCVDTRVGSASGSPGGPGSLHLGLCLPGLGRGRGADGPGGGAGPGAAPEEGRRGLKCAAEAWLRE